MFFHGEWVICFIRVSFPLFVLLLFVPQWSHGCNLDGLADVANNLIDKLSNAVGWVASHDTPERVAVNTYIQEIQNSNYDSITKAALISKAKKSIREYCNQKDIVRIALQAVPPAARPLNVEDDWLAQFMDKARLVSDTDFQILWGNILAEECSAPGSVPKALLHIMGQMDRNMAMAFMKVASVSVSVFDNGEIAYNPVIWGSTLDEYYEDLGIKYDDLVDLESVGLIHTKFGIFATGFCHECYDDACVIRYFDEEYQLPIGCKQFNSGNVIYTKAGTALCQAITPNKIDGFFKEQCVPKWEEEIKQKNSENPSACEKGV